MIAVDTHSHLNLSPLAEQADEVIARMRDAQVGTICVGVDAATSEMAVALATSHEDIWSCVGIHPTMWGEEFNAQQIGTLASNTRTVAIGECGLDYFRENERTAVAKETQKVLFKSHIELALRLNLPLMLHIRPQEGTMDAYLDALDILESYEQDLRGTAHFFVGTKEIADRFLNLGFHISFSGVITFVKEYEAVVAHVPLERILSETDAPFAAPAPYRGKTNEPAYVLEVIKKIADIKGLSLMETQMRLLGNARSLFGLSM